MGQLRDLASQPLSGDVGAGAMLGTTPPDAGHRRADETGVTYMSAGRLLGPAVPGHTSKLYRPCVRRSGRQRARRAGSRGVFRGQPKTCVCPIRTLSLPLRAWDRPPVARRDAGARPASVESPEVDVEELFGDAMEIDLDLLENAIGEDQAVLREQLPTTPVRGPRATPTASGFEHDEGGSLLGLGRRELAGIVEVGDLLRELERCSHSDSLRGPPERDETTVEKRAYIGAGKLGDSAALPAVPAALVFGAQVQPTGELAVARGASLLNPLVVDPTDGLATAIALELDRLYPASAGFPVGDGLTAREAERCDPGEDGQALSGRVGAQVDRDVQPTNAGRPDETLRGSVDARDVTSGGRLPGIPGEAARKLQATRTRWPRGGGSGRRGARQASREHGDPRGDLRPPPGPRTGTTRPCARRRVRGANVSGDRGPMPALQANGQLASRGRRTRSGTKCRSRHDRPPASGAQVFQI